MDSEKKRVRYEKAEAELLARFGNNLIPEYWRTTEMAELFGYKDATGAIKFCKRYSIPIYRYSGQRTLDEPTGQAIVICDDIKNLILENPKGWNICAKHQMLCHKYATVLPDKYPEEYRKWLVKTITNRFSVNYDLQEELMELQRHISVCLRQLLAKVERKYPFVVITIDKNNPENISSAEILDEAIDRIPEEDLDAHCVLELAQQYANVDFEQLNDLCRTIDNWLLMSKKSQEQQVTDDMLQMLRDYPKLSPILKTIED